MGINKDLSLPTRKMNKITIAFDVDGTLITNIANHKVHRYIGKVYGADQPNENIVNLLKILSKFKNVKIVVWSGGGKDYAQMWGTRLMLHSFVWKYAGKLDGLKPDIAIDDVQDCDLGKINLIVREK